MSNLVCVAEKGVVVLGSDSRFMLPDFSGIATDQARKIFEIAPGAYIACSGRKMACDFQPKRAREIAAELNRNDVRTIAQALERDTLPVLSELVQQLKAIPNPDERTAQAIRGDSLLHGSILVGRSDGRVGYVHHTYHVKDGEVRTRMEEGFDAPRKITFTSGAPVAELQAAAGGFMHDTRTWTDSPVEVVRRILAGLKRISEVSGGPDQCIAIDDSGARWIAEPPAELFAGEMASQTISAAITLTSPSLQINQGALSMLFDALNYIYISRSDFGSSVQVTYSQVTCTQTVTGSYSDMNYGGVEGYAKSGGATISSFSLSTGGVLRLNGPQARIYVNGTPLNVP